MFGYRTNAAATDVVDNIQKKYECCGSASGIDWAYSNTGSIIFTGTKRRRRFGHTANTLLEEDITSLFDDDSSALSSRTHYINRRETNYLDLPPTALMLASRKKRQVIPQNNLPYNLLYNDAFWAPRTCCSINTPGTGGIVQPSCTSYSQFYTEGCLKYIIRRSNQQDMGIGIINCFMIMLALMAIPFLIHGCPTSDVADNNNPEKQIQYIEQPGFNYSMPIAPVNTYL
ncbi:unnamed protein product [Rotaria sp. Silwood2]|nr:unnamed protein product [Rotaria sp. Silwood2]CAF4089356.1 unnamed protein product [Rotaria sp. Silwood2]